MIHGESFEASKEIIGEGEVGIMDDTVYGDDYADQYALAHARLMFDRYHTHRHSCKFCGLNIEMKLIDNKWKAVNIDGTAHYGCMKKTIKRYRYKK